ncbi:MAG: tRNA pseudouridine(55) synthase TruB [Clostridia bacterium]|nr:tRNA pseudouridine(55) synthase TruB [Clostridia bacterium]
MDGIIIINKEKGWTSNDVVQKVKHILGKKVGHIGTLDPLATGVLPLLIGKGTLLSKYLINHNKEYIATIKLGQKTNTADGEGEIVEEKIVDDKNLQEENVKKILNGFKGKIKQIPPIYSAIKVKGKKLYEYARKGKNVEIPPRTVEIFDIELLMIKRDLKEITFKVMCSKGTYIRSLCEDIAQKLNTVGFMKELQRTKVGDFKIEQSINISQIKDDYIISIEEFFKDKEKIIFNENEMKKFLNGVKITINKPDGIYRIYNESLEFIGAGLIKDMKIKRDICV